MFPDTPKTLLKKIAELARGDDRAEWEAFVELYEPPLKRFVRLQSPTMAEADVDDIVQDVFVRLVAVLREGKIDRTKAKFRAYLASMTRHILIDRYRAAQVRPQLMAKRLPELESRNRQSADFVDAIVSIASMRNETFLSRRDWDNRVHKSHPGSVPADALGSVPADALDPGTAVDILWRVAAHEAAKNHVFTKTAISEQSKRIYGLLERGLSPRETASQLGVSYDSVKQVKSRIDRAIAAIERRIVPAVATYL